MHTSGSTWVEVASWLRGITTYDKLGAIDQGQIVENKRLGNVLRIVQRVQAERDSRVVDAPSTAHRGNGKHVQKTKAKGTKRQRQLRYQDVDQAIGLVDDGGSQRRLKE